MKRILFYSGITTYPRDQFTLMCKFKELGYDVYFLNRLKSQSYKKVCLDANIKYYEFSGGNFKSFLYLIFFCYLRKISIVYSHLEPSNFLAVLSQYFIPSKVIICRHHIDSARRLNFDNSLTYRLTYKLAKRIIAVSLEAKNYMIKEEGINSDKIFHINLAFDFNLYEKPNEENVNKIREKYSADLLLITIGSLIQFKRPDVSIRVVQELRKNNIDVKLIILGEGEMGEELSRLIEDLGLKSAVFLEGYVTNVMEYLYASDYVVHPSVSESSCIVIKEAGLAKKPVFVCKDVGDFNEYIKDYQNGFLLDQKNFIEEACQRIQITIKDQEALKELGNNLFSIVYENFEISKVIQKYYPLNE